MKRAGAAKFPNSVQLFKFCQKVMMHQRGSKIHDQEIGQILSYNPSDCSHWKRGEKNVRSVFALAKLADTLQIETSLIHDVASGASGLDEAFFEYTEAAAIKDATAKMTAAGVTPEEISSSRKRVEAFVHELHQQAEFRTPPLYLPEVLRFFAFVQTQPIEMIDRLSRILRTKPGQYMINFRKGDLRPQTRMSMVRDLGRIIFEGERERFPELGALNPALVGFEQLVFAAGLLLPKTLMLNEMSKLDARRNVIAELAALFWAPKLLVGFQLQDILRTGERLANAGLMDGGLNTGIPSLSGPDASLLSTPAIAALSAPSLAAG